MATPPPKPTFPSSSSLSIPPYRTLYSLLRSIPTTPFSLLIAFASLFPTTANAQVSNSSSLGQTIDVYGQKVSVPDCSLATDTFVGNAQDAFRMGSWMSRGMCIRGENVDLVCYTTLVEVLKNLNGLRSAEYNGAAGLLSLLPTIGALLGAPTNEIWRLLTIVPFGGVLAMALSFGGAILPIRVEDYESSLSKSNNSIGSILTFRGLRATNPADLQKEMEKKENDLIKRLKRRMQQSESMRLSNSYLWFGFLGMILLFLGAQAAMIVVELGGILPWWCVTRWWMHFWYGLVTITAVTENWTQLPFSKQWKLFVSDVPYDITLSGGDDITASVSSTIFSGVETALHQLSTLKAASVTIRGSHQYTHPRNAVLIMVSVVDLGNSPSQSLWRQLSKMASIGVFVTGTAFFASVQLLALPMAIMALTLVISAAIFGRAIASWIVTGVDKSEPMLHVICNSTDEAYAIIRRILTLGEHGKFTPSYLNGTPPIIPAVPENFAGPSGMQEVNLHDKRHQLDLCKETDLGSRNMRDEDLGSWKRNIQVEINGHVFVGCRRVGMRSSLHVRLMGIMAQPYDLRKVSSKRSDNLLDISSRDEEARGILPR